MIRSEGQDVHWLIVTIHKQILQEKAGKGTRCALVDCYTNPQTNPAGESRKRELCYRVNLCQEFSYKCGHKGVVIVYSWALATFPCTQIFAPPPHLQLSQPPVNNLHSCRVGI